MLPLITSLFVHNRVVVVKVYPDLKYVARKVSEFDSYSDILSNISSQNFVYSVQFFQKDSSDQLFALTTNLDYSENDSCESIISGLGMSLIPQQGYRFQIRKLAEKTIGNEILMKARLREVAGNESLKLLVTQVPIKNLSLAAGSKIKDMNEFYDKLKSEQNVSITGLGLIKKFFNKQEIGFKQLFEKDELAMTDEKLQGLNDYLGLRTAILALIKGQQFPLSIE